MTPMPPAMKRKRAWAIRTRAPRAETRCGDRPSSPSRRRSGVVHLDGAAATVRYAPDRDSIRVAHCRITAQRVLPDASAGQVDVDVRAGKPRGRGAVHLPTSARPRPRRGRRPGGPPRDAMVWSGSATSGGRREIAPRRPTRHFARPRVSRGGTARGAGRRSAIAERAIKDERRAPPANWRDRRPPARSTPSVRARIRAESSQGCWSQTAFGTAGGAPSSSLIRSRLNFHQPMSVLGSVFTRYHAARWKNTKIIATAIVMARIRST